MYVGCCTSIHEINDHTCHFYTIWNRQMLFIHHDTCNFKYMSILPFGYSVLLRCVSACALSMYPFLLKVCFEGFWEVLLSPVRPKAPSSRFFFYSTFELLEMWEQFLLLSHWEDPSVSGVVVDEGDVVAACIECCSLSFSKHLSGLHPRHLCSHFFPLESDFCVIFQIGMLHILLQSLSPWRLGVWWRLLSTTLPCVFGDWCGQFYWATPLC